FGEYEGKIIIEHDNTRYTIPVMIHITKGSLFVNEQDGKLDFKITYPDEWSYAKISIINKETGEIETTSATPNKIATLDVSNSGIYWIEGKITSDNTISDVYDIIDVSLAENKKEIDFFSFLDIPQKTILIIVIVTATIAVVGLKLRR
ncbi:MAG: S8 family serine peptidase, partial [Nitrososphaerota archaeon]